MHHRALCRLKQTATLTFAGPFSFTQLLQAAAGRAWTRRVSSFPATFTKAPREQINQGSSSRSYGKSVRKSGIAPEIIRKHGFATNEMYITRPDSEGEYMHAQDRNPTTSAIYTIDNTQHSTSASSQEVDEPLPATNWNDPETCSNGPRLDEVKDELLHPEAEAIPPPEKTTPAPLKDSYLLPSPTSQKMLLYNLRRAIHSKPPLNPPTLVDYHEAYPQFQSTKSYNFLIDMAIRHTHYGTAQWLFDAMIHAGIVRDKFTRKLLVRWLVRTGRWEQAWMQATGLTPDEALDKPLRNGSAPLITKISCGLWQELLYTHKRGALRRPRELRSSKYEVGTNVRLPWLEVIKDPAPGTEAYLRRQQLLACVQPVILHDKSNWISPKVIKASIYSILRDGRAAAAVEVAKTYFSSLPVDISSEYIAQCLDIIHLLLSADVENGHSSLVANRRLLLSLLKTHASLKPSSKTLLLLLAPLKKAKKSGTVAFVVLKAFRKSWGPDIVDVFVRRRVISLAKKEGRKDLVEKMSVDRNARKQGVDEVDAPVDTTVQPTTLTSGLHRPPDREISARTTGDEGTVCKQRASWVQGDKDPGDTDTLE